MARPSVEGVLGVVREIARVPLFGFLREHPAENSFYHGRDLDRSGRLYRDLQSIANGSTSTALAEDPRQAAIEADDVRPRFTLDERFDVHYVELTTG